MTEELDILKIVAENPEISQRKIAEKTGISLGQVNFIIKKCIRKGLIKIEGQTSKSLKYNLTPQGITEKAALTLEYIKISYASVLALTNKIKDQADNYLVKGINVYVYGHKDEMMDIVRLSLGDRVSYINNITDTILCCKDIVIFYWDEDLLSNLKLDEIKAVNILR